MKTINYNRTAGFSIVELMIAMLLSAFLLLIILSTFMQSNRNQRQDEQLNIIQENGRFAIRAATRALSLGSFWGGLPDPGGITVDPGVGIAGCNAEVTNVATNSIALLNDTSAADLVAAYSCVDNSDFIAGTDALAVLRVADSPVTSQVANGTYLAANAATGILFQGTGLPAGAVAPVNVWRYVPEIYYIVDQPDAAGNAVPTLCRYALGENTASMDRRCLADGIENMQIEYGIDTNDDYIADYYDNAPAAAEQANAVSAKVYFLVRSITELPGYTNNKTYNLGSTEILPANDGYLRRVFSATIELKNSSQLSVTPFEAT